MAATAAPIVNTAEGNAKNQDIRKPSRPHSYMHSVSRTSLTFFSSDNAINASRAKLDSIRSEWLLEEQTKIKNEETGSDEQSTGKENLSPEEEKLFAQKVLDYCVGGKFDLQEKYVLQEPFNVLVYLQLVQSVSTETQLYLLTLLQNLLKQSIKNLQACTKIGLIAKLLKILPDLQDEAVADKTIDLVGDLATYSITVRELKCFFAALQRTDEMKWPPHALKLLEILKKMPEKHGPDVYFNFSGKPGSSITIPPISKWPHQPGFAFVTWLQLDAEHLSPSEQQNRPHIFSFMNNRGLGYSAHFSGPMLVIEIWGKSGKKTILVKSKFEPQMWYHICISLTYNRFKSSEVKIFVNGQMVTSSDATMPSNKDPMDKCFIGGSHVNTAQHVYKGQMSAIYVFSEPLAYNTVIALYRLGPGYKGNFKFRNELDSTIAETDKKLIYESKLSQIILFTYNPKAVDGELCLESSPAENSSCFYHSPHAMMMDALLFIQNEWQEKGINVKGQGVHAVVTHSLQAAMHSLGGIQMLFPLFTQLDYPLEEKNESEPKIWIFFNCDVPQEKGTSQDVNVKNQMIQSQGFMIIGHLLQKSSPIHLTEETVDILLGLARYFMATASATGLLGGLLDHVLLEPSLWIKTPLSLQSNLLSLFATGYVGGLDYAGYIRKEVGVPRLILMLRKYYSIKSPGQNSCFSKIRKQFKIVVAELSSEEEVISLRAFVLLLIKQMIIKDKGITEDELKSILVYLAVENEEENYFDIVQLLLSVMCEMPAAIIPCFDIMEGFQVFFKLLVAHDEKIRVCSLKILCAYMQQLNVKRKLDLIERYAFISKIGQKLYIFDMTLMTYNALFEFLTARPTKIISDKRHASPDSGYVMYHPTVLPIIVSLLLKGRQDVVETGNEDLHKSINDITSIFLSDLVLLLTSNNDNKRLLLQLMCWQDWLFSLAYYEPTTKDEHKVTDNVFSVVKMLLYYAIQHEKEGWRVWVDTLSILHGKVSQYMKKAYPEIEPSKDDIQPTTIHNEQTTHPEYIDQETGEVKTNPTHESPAKTSPTKSPVENDLRKKFFERILHKDGGTSVISGQLDGLRRSQSADNVNEENTEENSDTRPRSASPTVDTGIKLAEKLKEVSINGPQKEVSDEGNNPTENQKEPTVEVINRESITEATDDVSTTQSDSKTKSPVHSIELQPGQEISSTDLNSSVTENEVSDSGSDSLPKSPEKPKTRPYVDIPEFSWSHPHQRLLSELLFFIEKDIQVWKTHTRKSLTDFVSSRDNHIYIMNLCHMVSILSDSLIYCCGGLLPLVASATSQNFANDVLEACGGMTLDAAFSFLNRVLDVIDIVAFASSMNFASVETHRNISAGGVLRQCIRLVFCGAARNRVVCRQRERPSTSNPQSQHHHHIHPKTFKETQEAIKTLIASTKAPTEEDVVQNIPGHMTTITNPEKLLQDPDINRLRALVYREVEDSRQSQYVALVVIYFVAVLMVARYRDILEHEDVEEPVSRSKWQGVGFPQEKGHSSATDPDEASTPRDRSSTWAAGQKPTNQKSPSTPREKKEKPVVLTLEEKIEAAFSNSASLLREILFDYSHYLMRVLVGSRGQDLISDGLGSLKSEESTVELVMLLCSQEWQNALQRQAGTAFMDLVDEGRLLSHSTRERIVITGSEAKDIMTERDNFEIFKHAQFETLCTKTLIGYIEQYKTYDQFFKAKKKRNTASATQSLEKIFDVLTSEFGAWSLPEAHSHPQYYKLDRWEDMSRRRLRVIKNPMGTSHPEAQLILGSAEVIPPEKPPPLKYHLYAKKKIPSSSVSPNDETSNNDLDDADEKEDADDEDDDEDDDDDIDLDATLDEKQPYHHHGSIVITTECHVVSPGAVIPGTLAITNDSLYFTADEDSEELKKIDSQIITYNDCLNIKCSFVNIVAIYTRRYILQHKAIEIFLANRRSFMFAFSSHETVKKIIQYLPPAGVGNNLGLPKTRNVSLANPKLLFSKSNMLQRWQNREISNFDYLMFLNTIAGRTCNDLNQYFVFPWVLKNYESEDIDLKDPNNYRDLSKPIGALNPFRLAQFVERFNSWDDSGDVPPFHYGTHYSTAGFVMNWMVRVEPYASLFLSLQGGKFDHPLRTFSSIKRAWDNCQRDTSDVKELIPELFYSPDMLRNDNKFVFGVGEDNQDINHVLLPPWARSPDHFINLHREALESDYVSSNLHKWIDLIFGYKQKGRDAEHNANVFYHLTYEGSVNLDDVTDPVTKEALIQQIKSFGQTPGQLLTTPHPPRNNLMEENKEPHKSIFLSFSVTPEVPVTHVTAYTGTKTMLPAIITISCNQFFSVNKWINFGGSITSYHSLKDVQIEQDPSLETAQGRLRRQLGEPLHESITVTSQCFSVTSDNRFIFACGYWDKSFKCFSTDSGKLTQCIFGHWDVVTCLAYSDDNLTSSNAIIVSGSLDCTVLVWIWDHKRHRIIGPDDPSGHGSTPIAICTGHELPITCVDVNTSVGIIASGCVEGACLIHSLSGELLRILKGPPLCQHPRLINISNEGRVLVNYSNDTGYMAMFSLNGNLLSYVKLNEQNLAVVFTRDSCFFVTGGFSRSFQIWRSFDLVLLSVYPECDGSIRTLALTPDQRCMVAGLSTGSIIAMAMDFTMWPRVAPPAQPVSAPAESSVETTESQQTTEASTTTTTTTTVVTETDTKESEMTEAERVAARTPSPTTQLIHGVPEDDVDDAAVTKISKELEEEEESTKTQESTPQVKQTSSLTAPVPDDDNIESETPKTLLQTVKDAEKEVDSEKEDDKEEA